MREAQEAAESAEAAASKSALAIGSLRAASGASVAPPEASRRPPGDTLGGSWKMFGALFAPLGFPRGSPRGLQLALGAPWADAKFCSTRADPDDETRRDQEDEQT